MNIYFKFEQNPISRFFSTGEQSFGTDKQRTGNVKNPIPGTERGAYANAAPSTITGVMPEARPIYSSKYPSKLNFGCVGFKNTLCRR